MAEDRGDRPSPAVIYCPICGKTLAEDFDIELAADYPGLVCKPCDGRSLNVEGQPARSEGTGAYGEDGDNPVFIDSQRCWRRYRFGGWLTMIDPYDSESLEAFYEHQHSDRGGSGQR